MNSVSLLVSCWHTSSTTLSSLFLVDGWSLLTLTLFITHACVGCWILTMFRCWCDSQLVSQAVSRLLKNAAMPSSFLVQDLQFYCLCFTLISYLSGDTCSDCRSYSPSFKGSECSFFQRVHGT